MVCTNAVMTRAQFPSQLIRQDSDRGSQGATTTTPVILCSATDKYKAVSTETRSHSATRSQQTKKASVVHAWIEGIWHAAIVHNGRDHDYQRTMNRRPSHVRLRGRGRVMVCNIWLVSRTAVFWWWHCQSHLFVLTRTQYRSRSVVQGLLT